MEILTYNFYGNFGITANNIKHITQYKNCIYLWFTDKYIDDETINNGTVTIRNRDTMKQEIIKIEDIENYINERTKF